MGELYMENIYAPGNESTNENINVSWDYGIILVAYYTNSSITSNLRYPIYFIPGTDIVTGSVVTNSSENWNIGIINLISNVTESSFTLFAHTYLYFILVSYV